MFSFFKKNLFSVQKKLLSNLGAPTKKHTNQVVIDLVQDDIQDNQFSKTANSLVNKWNARNPKNPSTLIHLLDIPKQKKSLPKDANNRLTQIYVVAHGSYKKPGIVSNGLKGADNINISPFQLANILKEYLTNNTNVRINLVVCEAGKGLEPNSKDSFGAQLHAHLAMLTQQDISVVACKTIVVVNTTLGTKKTVMLDNYAQSRQKINKLAAKKNKLPIDSEERAELNRQMNNYDREYQIGSKVLYQLNNHGNQLTTDAYDDKWKTLILNYLRCAPATGKLKDYLQVLAKIFENKTSCEIANTLVKELNTKNSFLNLNRSFLFPSPTKAAIRKNLGQFLDERIKIISSPHAIGRMETGNKFLLK